MTVRLVGLSRRFDGRAVVDDVTLTVPDGELLALLGPSGCGKTTTLRMIAGHEGPDAGRIVIGNEDVTERPPELRRQLGVGQHDPEPKTRGPTAVAHALPYVDVARLPDRVLTQTDQYPANQGFEILIVNFG